MIHANNLSPVNILSLGNYPSHNSLFTSIVQYYKNPEWKDLGLIELHR